MRLSSETYMLLHRPSTTTSVLNQEKMANYAISPNRGETTFRFTKVCVCISSAPFTSTLPGVVYSLITRSCLTVTVIFSFL